MPEYNPRSKFYGLSDSEAAKVRASDAAFAAARAGALERRNVNPVGVGPASDEFRLQQAADNERRDASRPLKGSLPAFSAPPVGSALWAAQPQAALQNQSPSDVHGAWTNANLAAMQDESRAELARRWRRPITADEASANPAIAKAAAPLWDEPGVRQRSASRADAEVPTAKVLRQQLPPGSAYSVG